MSKSYFEFKQFTVKQDKCAMKVGTDGVLLGAFASVENPSRILDVGTGSGLVALMLAQRYGCPVDAIEIDGQAAKQAQDNVKESAWCGRITVSCVSLQEFVKECPEKYDLIVSNPPYFSTGKPSFNTGRATARHTNCLSLADLIGCSGNLLSNTGRVCVVLPYEQRRPLLSQAAKHSLWVDTELKIRPVPATQCNRIIVQLSRGFPLLRKQEELIVELNQRHEYSEEFKALTQDYYKHFHSFRHE